jgi:ribosomal protein L24
MKLGDKVKVIKGDYNGRVGIIKSKDHSYRNFGIKRYGLRFNIVEEKGNLISVDANDVKMVEIKKKVSGDKKMKIKIDDRVRIVRGEHIGKVGIVKSIDHAVIGSYPNQTYTKTFSIMSNNGNVFSIDANDAKLIEG